MTPRTQLKKICLGLPEATEQRSVTHAAYVVRNKKLTPAAMNDEDAARLWELSAALTRVHA